MQMPNVQRLAFAALAISALVHMQARAATITYTTLHDNGGLGYGNGTVGSYTDPQFNDLGGLLTLTKVSLTVTILSTGGEHEFDNESGAGATITLGIGSQVRVKGPLPGIGSQIIVNPDATTTITGFVTADTDGAPDFAGTDYLDKPSAFATDIRSAFKTSIFDIAPYIGTGTATFDFDGGTSTTGTSALPSPGANKVTFGTTNFEFYTTLEYTYTPEPSTLALLGVGGIGALVYAARRRSRARSAHPA